MRFLLFLVAMTMTASAETTVVPHVPAQGQPEYSTSVPHGVVRALSYQSTALGMPRECWIYTPHQYETGGEDYPLLVLQHAGADTQKTWVMKGNVDWLLDDLIGTNKAQPMIVLMLDGHPKGESVYTGPATRVAAMNDLERELFDDAMPLVEKEFRARKLREWRALAGPSIGGGQTLSLGLKNLDRFAWLGVFNAGHPIREFMQPTLADPTGTNARLRLLWISCATGDAHFAENEKLHAELAALDLRHEWFPTEGAHGWSVWRRDLTAFLLRVFQH